MDKNIELIYKGNYNPVLQFLIFMVIHLAAFGSVYLFNIEHRNVWVMFQTILFFYTTSSLVSGAFTNNHALHYYPAIIISFIIFFFLGKKLAEISSQIQLDDIPYMKNFVTLNILFFTLFLLVTNVFRWAKQKFETM